MSGTCRYCGSNPRKNCYAKEGEGCEYPKYKRTAILIEIRQLKTEIRQLKTEIRQLKT